nr:MAG TPA: hypothetical protein [Bacteriophage sp.]
MRSSWSNRSLWSSIPLLSFFSTISFRSFKGLQLLSSKI